GFKRVEISLRPPEIPGLMACLRDAGAACAGMSSFGPTVYAVTDTSATGILSAANGFLEEHGGGEAWVSAPRNTGARARGC
ncbi:MAG TPA: DUF98 domain-containing protein, partial [Methanomicrobiales archaeon]|nr:DUF98 domain-containing protein [Methanomicrobiales archaeon]